ncbi:MAG: glycosyltransferase family 4 protein [Planctomycetota bacterium]
MRIAYLASEIPSRSATFVFREIIEVERHGNTVVPFATHVNTCPAAECDALDLVSRVTVLYSHPMKRVIEMVQQTVAHPIKTLSAFAALCSDIGTLSPKMAFKCVFQFGVALALVWRLRAQHCERIHAHFAHTPGTIAMYASIAAGIPFSITAHANDIFERPVLMKAKLRRARPFATISEFNRSFLNYTYGNSPIEIVRCGIGAEVTGQDASPARTSGEPMHIVGLGRLVATKGFDVLLVALSELEKRGVKWTCTVAGGGPEWDRLTSLSRTLNLPAGQLVFSGAMAPENVRKLLETADAFVLPCRKGVNGDMDGIPVVLMEAMAMCKPCVSTRLSGIPELIKHGKTGFLTEPENPTELADALQSIYEHPEEADKLALNGQVWVRSVFSRSRNVDLLCDMWARPVREPHTTRHPTPVCHV